MEEGTKKSISNSDIDIEKIAVYAALLITFVTAMIYIADIKERTKALEVKVEKLEERK